MPCSMRTSRKLQANLFFRRYQHLFQRPIACLLTARPAPTNATPRNAAAVAVPRAVDWVDPVSASGGGPSYRIPNQYLAVGGREIGRAHV